MAQDEILGTIVPGSPGWRRFLFWLAQILDRLLLRLHVVGRENIPAAGPVIVIINHISFADPVVVWSIIRRLIIPMAKIEAFDLPVISWMMRVGGTIAVHRGEADMQAVKQALQVLKRGGMVLLAPEGTRSRTHQMQPARDGAAMLALRSGAAVLPVAVTGTHRAKACWRRLRRVPVSVVVGAPFHLNPAGGKKASREELAELTSQMMNRLAALLPSEYRGVYSRPEIAPTDRLIFDLES